MERVRIDSTGPNAPLFEEPDARLHCVASSLRDAHHTPMSSSVDRPDLPFLRSKRYTVYECACG